MLDRLIPDFVACVETRRDQVDIDLFAAELASLGRAVPHRRQEFMAGRACARAALERLGVPITPIPSGPNGEPLWPPGIVGSITHCRGYRACAAARSGTLLSLGIDAEPNAPLPDGVLEMVAHGHELQLAAAASGDRDLQVDVGRLLFSAKEAVYKAWFPLAGRWLGFEDVRLFLGPAQAGFRAELQVPGPLLGSRRLTEFHGRWTVEDGLICTAVVVPATEPPPPHDAAP